MDIQQKIKLMLTGKFTPKYATGKRFICTICGCASPKAGNSKITCGACRIKYLTRDSGSFMQGMDYTRELVRIRDKYTCLKCAKKWKRGNRRFDVHHLGGLCGRFSRSYDKVEDMGNLVTLCHKCHLNLPEVTEKMRNKSGRWKESL